MSVLTSVRRLGPEGRLQTSTLFGPVPVRRKAIVGRLASRTILAGVVALCGLAAPPTVDAQVLVDMKVEVATDQSVPAPEVQSRSSSFTIPGSGRIRITYRQLKYRGYSPWGGFRFTFPGSADSGVPGRPVGPDRVEPRSAVEGMPYEMEFVREFDAAQANMKIGVALTALGYLQSRGDPPIVHVHAQSTSLKVEWLGGGSGAGAQPPAPPGPGQWRGVEGRWNLNANNSGGWIEFDSGRVYIDGNEPITNVVFDPGTGRISFVRPLTHLGAQYVQRYSGVLSGGEIHGTFTQGGTGSYLWCATRGTRCTPRSVDSPPSPAGPPSVGAGPQRPAPPSPGQWRGVEGRWVLNANNSRGWIEFDSGRVYIDGNEPITNVVFDPGTGRISFVRPLTHLGARFTQRYSGVLSGGEIHGTFTQGGTGSYLWCATRGTRCTPRSVDVPPSPAGPPSVGASPSTGMTLRAESRRVEAGGTVTLPIWLDRAAGVANMNFDVLYDPAVVQAGEVVRGAFVPRRTMFEANPGEAGTVRVGMADNRDLSGSGPVAQIAFRAVGRPGAHTAVRLRVTTVSSASNARPTVQTSDGRIEIVSGAGLVPGDSNGNGVLDAGDALDALKMSVKLIPEKPACDLDHDGQVTSTDARLILQKVVGK